MKKLFLILFALIALGLSQVNAQDPVITPTPLSPTCIDLTNPLTPVPGNPYTYTVSVPNPPGNKSYRWYVTQDPNFAVAGNYNWGTAEAIPGAILAAGSGWYNVLTPDQPTISLTWQSFVLNPGEYVFVVIYVENVDPVLGCTTNNIKVYRIQPLHAFTLDIANVDTASNAIAAASFPQCVDDVQSAIFNPLPAPDGSVVYNYGKNIFYYAIAAANYSGQFLFTAVVNGLQNATPAGVNGQTAEIYWGYSIAGMMANGPYNVTVAGNGVPQNLGIVSAPAGGSVGSAGQMIYVKIIIRNNQFEADNNVASYPYTFAINGKLCDATGTPLVGDDTRDDLHFANCLPDLYVNDIATQLLLTRPTINSVSPPPPGFLPNGN